jgi:hypothetical protein
MYSHRNAWATLHLLGQPNIFLAPARRGGARRWTACGLRLALRGRARGRPGLRQARGGAPPRGSSLQRRASLIIYSALALWRIWSVGRLNPQSAGRSRAMGRCTGGGVSCGAAALRAGAVRPGCPAAGARLLRARRARAAGGRCRGPGAVHAVARSLPGTACGLAATGPARRHRTLLLPGGWR